MKIRAANGEVVDVFAVYWFDSSTYFYGMPSSYGGLIAYKEVEVTIIDSKMVFSTIFYKGEGRGKGLFHWALIEEKLLDDLLESDETAYHRFLEIIKSEGLVDSDFY